MRLSALITPVLRSSTVGSSSRGGRSVATSRGFEDADCALGDGGRSARQGEVGLRRCLERSDDRLVASLDVGEA